MRFKFLLSLLILLVFPFKVFAADSPQLSSPADGLTVFSPKLQWFAPSYPLYSGNSYRVQVDEDSSFSSLNKDYYTDNTYYTPTLLEGLWHWRVKAKDVGGVWSDWSSVWSFILTSDSSSPSPSPTPDPSSDPLPSLDPTPTPTPIPTPQPTPQPTSDPQSSSFLISGVPSAINSDQLFNVSVNLSLPNNPNTKFYLKGAFKRSDGSNYFGFTKVEGNWVKNGSSYTSQFPITTDSSGNWYANLEVKVDSEDAGFTGEGDYLFKIGRYTSSGSGPTWSNEESIKIIAVLTQTDDQGGVSGLNTSSKATPKPTSTATNSIKNTNLNTSSIIKLPKNSQIAESSIAGIESSPSSRPAPVTSEVLSKKGINYIPWIGGGFILAGLLSLILLYLKNKGIYGNFFKRIR